MRSFVGPVSVAACLLALLWLWVPSSSQGFRQQGSPKEIKFYDTDSGKETAQKFVRFYARLVANGLEPIIEKQERGEFDGTLPLVQEVANSTTKARESATEGVNRRFALLKDASQEEVTQFLKSFRDGMSEVGQ